MCVFMFIFIIGINWNVYRWSDMICWICLEYFLVKKEGNRGDGWKKNGKILVIDEDGWKVLNWCMFENVYNKRC